MVPAMVMLPATAPATVMVGSLFEPVAVLVSWTGVTVSVPLRSMAVALASVVLAVKVTSTTSDCSFVGASK
jgi:hypothetical protein